MGPLGMLLLMCGFAVCAFGIIGILVSLVSLDTAGIGVGILMVAGGLVSGAIGTAILE